MKLFTIIFCLSDRTSMTQVQAESPEIAFETWADGMRIRQGLGHPFPDGLAVAEELTPHDHFPNVWRSFASEGEHSGMVHIVQTEPAA